MGERSRRDPRPGGAGAVRSFAAQHGTSRKPDTPGQSIRSPATAARTLFSGAPAQGEAGAPTTTVGATWGHRNCGQGHGWWRPRPSRLVRPGSSPGGPDRSSTRKVWLLGSTPGWRPRAPRGVAQLGGEQLRQLPTDPHGKAQSVRQPQASQTLPGALPSRRQRPRTSPVVGPGTLWEIRGTCPARPGTLRGLAWAGEHCVAVLAPPTLRPPPQHTGLSATPGEGAGVTSGASDERPLEAYCVGAPGRHSRPQRTPANTPESYR